MRLRNIIIILLVFSAISCNSNKEISDIEIKDRTIYQSTSDSLFRNMNNYQLYEKSKELNFQKKHQKGLEILLELEKSEPENKLVLEGLGITYSYLNNFSLSEEYFKKVIAVDSLFFNGYINLSTLYINKKDYELAYQTIMRASNIEKTEMEEVFYIMQQANLNHFLGNCEEALTLCNMAMNLINDRDVIDLITRDYNEIKKACITKN